MENRNRSSKEKSSCYFTIPFQHFVTLLSISFCEDCIFLPLILTINKDLFTMFACVCVCRKPWEIQSVNKQKWRKKVQIHFFFFARSSQKKKIYIKFPLDEEKEIIAQQSIYIFFTSILLRPRHFMIEFFAFPL